LVQGDDPEGIFVDWPPDSEDRFPTPAALADWVRATCLGAETELTLIGHSMGGLVAVDLAGLLGARVRRVILVESFMTPPGPFFRNLLLESAPEPLRVTVTQMLQRGQAKASTALRAALQVDYSPKLPDLTCQLSAAYGDRGCGDRTHVMAALGWSPAVAKRVPVTIVPNACHFPMLENPEVMRQILRENAAI
jgi:pimeloyl-ACP methyl ester carboxylesterase